MLIWDSRDENAGEVALRKPSHHEVIIRCHSRYVGRIRKDNRGRGVEYPRGCQIKCQCRTPQQLQVQGVAGGFYAPVQAIKSARRHAEVETDQADDNNDRYPPPPSGHQGPLPDSSSP